MFEAPSTNCTGDTVGVGVARGLQLGVAETPGEVPFLLVVAAGFPAPLDPPCRVPLPAGEPPPLPPACPDGCPVSMVELTWTIACRNGGTAKAMLAMKATPASTAAGRSQARPVGRAGFRAGAACRGGTLFVPAAGSSRNRGRGSEPGQGRISDQAQWPRQTQCRAWPKAPAATLTSHGCGWRPLVLARIRLSASAPGSTWLTAAASARRSVLSRPSSGAVMPSPGLPA